MEAKEVHAMRRKFKEERERQRKEVVERAKRKHQAVAGKKGGAQRAAEIKRVRAVVSSTMLVILLFHACC